MFNELEVHFIIRHIYCFLKTTGYVVHSRITLEAFLLFLIVFNNAIIYSVPFLVLQYCTVVVYTAIFIRQLLRTIIILLPLFCFTWVIGLFAVAPGQAGQVFAVLFIVANSLQVLNL